MVQWRHGGSLLRGLVDLGRSGPPEIEAVCAEHKGGGLISCPPDGNLLLNGAPPSCFARPNIPRMNIEGEGWSIICLLDSKQ